MPYEEVRSALMVGKIIANEAVKYVRVLNFMKSCQLDGPSTRRFASVEEVNCLCLISGQLNSFVLCSETTARLVPLLTLLTTFAKLKSVYVGGLVTRRAWNGEEQLVRCSYHPDYCSSPTNHRELAKAFYHSFIGAFKARLIPLDLHVEGGFVNFVDEIGLCSRRGDAGDDANSEGMCAICRDVCSYLPLDEIIEQPYFCECATNIDVLEAISKRKGAEDVFRKDSDYLPDFIDGRLKDFAVGEEALRRRLADFGMTCDDKDTWYLTMAGINDIDRMIAIGFDPRAVSKESLYKGMQIGLDDRQYDVFAKSTFDALIARGFALDEADLIVLDERMEPALKDLPALIRGRDDNK